MNGEAILICIKKRRKRLVVALAATIAVSLTACSTSSSTDNKFDGQRRNDTLLGNGSGNFIGQN